MAKLNRTQMMERSLGKFIPKNSGSLTTPSITHHNSSGSPILDFLPRKGLGPPGFPGGKFVDIFGTPGAGKTALVMRCIREAQIQGGLGIYISSEGIDEYWCGGPLGVDLKDSDRWIYFEGATLEAALGAFTAAIWEFHDADYPVVIAIDSLSAHGSQDNSMANKAIGDTKQAAADAKACHEWNRSGVGYYLSGSRITPIVVRHETESPRMFSGVKTTHGQSFDYSAWLRLKLSSKPLLHSDGKTQLGTWCKVKNWKSKIGWGSWSHSMPVYWDDGWDTGMELISWLLDNCKKEFKVDTNGRLALLGQSRFPSEFRKQFRVDEGFANELESLVYEKLLAAYQK